MHSCDGAVEYSQILSQGWASLSPSRELNKSTEDKMSNIVMIAKMTPNSEYLNYFKIIIENVNNFYVGKLIGKNFLQLN